MTWHPKSQNGLVAVPSHVDPEVVDLKVSVGAGWASKRDDEDDAATPASLSPSVAATSSPTSPSSSTSPDTDYVLPTTSDSFYR